MPECQDITKSKKKKEMKKIHTDSTEMTTETAVTEDYGKSTKKKRKCNDLDDSDQNVPSVVLKQRNHHKKRKMDSAAEEHVALCTSTKVIDKATHTSTLVTQSGVESTDGSTDNGHISGTPESAMHLLLDRMAAVIKETKTKKVEDYKTTLHKLDWTKVCFDHYGPDDCKTLWSSIFHQMRKLRTLEEILEEAKSKTFKDPMKPKFPCSAMFLFFNKKRASFARKHPGMPPTELVRLMAKKFEKMSASKKQKYTDEYHKAKAIYDLEMVKYRAEQKKKMPAVKKMSAAHYFVYKKCSMKTLTPEQKKKATKKYLRRWDEMTTDNKVKFINEALAASEDYKQKLESDPTCNEPFVPNIVLTKPEQSLKDKAEGKTISRPRNGFSIFVEKFCKESRESGSSTNLKAAAAAWQSLSAKKRAHFDKKAAVARSQYDQDHPSSMSKSQLFRSAPKRMRSPYQLFTHEMLGSLIDLKPPVDRIQECSKQWAKLSKSEKDLWKIKYDAAQQHYVQELDNFKKTLTDEQLKQFELFQKPKVKAKKNKIEEVQIGKLEKVKKKKAKDATPVDASQEKAC